MPRSRDKTSTGNGLRGGHTNFRSVTSVAVMFGNGLMTNTHGSSSASNLATSGSNAADATVGGSGSVTIPAGETTAAIPITLLQDFRVEASETLILKLSSPDRALLGDATFTLTITDDEPKAKCDGKDATIVGSNGPDTIKGTPGADVIVGRRGTDKIDGLAGNDTICGTGGADELAGGGGNDMLIGGNGNDQLMGESGKDTLDGGLGRDRFSGGPGDGDTCKGGPGTDTLEPKHGCEVVDTIP